MADGTPIDSLENGDIENTSDASRVQEIIKDLNASGADVSVGSSPQMPPPQQMPSPHMQQSYMPMPYMPMPSQQMPPMTLQHPSINPNYVPIDDPAPRTKKKNVWSNAFDYIRDPIIVAVIVFIVSLPVLHTYFAKYASWAFAVGGQLSYIGLASISLFAGILFGIVRAAGNLLL